jgi:hypothetical protein
MLGCCRGREREERLAGDRALWGAAEEVNGKSPKSNPKLLILKYGG